MPDKKTRIEQDRNTDRTKEATLTSHIVYLYSHALVLLWTLPTTSRHWTMSEKHTRAMSNKNNMINYLLQDINDKFLTKGQDDQ